MIKKKEYPLEKIKTLVKKEKENLKEIRRYSEEVEKSREGSEEREIIQKRLDILEEDFKKSHEEILNILHKFDRPDEEIFEEEEIKKRPTISEDDRYLFREGDVLRTRGGKVPTLKEMRATVLERQTFKRLKKARKKKEESLKKPKKRKNTQYSEISSRFFSKLSKDLLGSESFQRLERDLVKANLDYAPTGYISMILFSTILSIIVAGFIFLFFLFFNVEAIVPFITRATDTINVRFAKVFWILFVIPLGTFAIMYLYPSLEKKSAEAKIDIELPFASIHMAAISGSMINPIKIFEIIIFTKEYPAIEREFTKILNDINVYGSDLVSALKNSAKNTSSKKLSELLNGLSTTINSGGDLVQFFDKRSQSLLFEYKLAREKSSKAAETFMDIYISVVIAAPMILMLLLMMMKISGLGLSMSVQAITLMMVLGVVVINIVFITFLHIKRSE